MSIAILLKRALPGARTSVAGHIKRGESIAGAIQRQFKIGEPYQWQAKHLRWVMEAWSREFSPSTRYDYWRTARALASVLGHWPNWEPYLRGPWCKKGIGGRKPKLARPKKPVPAPRPI